MALGLQCVTLPVEESVFHGFVTVVRNLDLEPELPRLNDCVCLEKQKLRPDSGPTPLSQALIQQGCCLEWRRWGKSQVCLQANL